MHRAVMSYFLKIERFPYEEPDYLHLAWEVSNGSITSNFDFYLNASDLRLIGKSLKAFPRHASDVYLYEIGSENPEDRIAYYFRLRAFTTDSVGHSAIQVRFNNNRNLPYKEISEFCIRAEPAGINRLGKLFEDFSKLETDILVWSEAEAFVGGKYENT
jgi:hypothetical protein